MNIYEGVQRIVYQSLKDQRYKYYDLTKKNLQLSKAEMVELQNKLIRNIVKYAYNKTSYYQELLDQNGIRISDINNKNDLRKIPLLTKTILRENIDKIKSSDEYSLEMKEVTSGGSTGNQSIVFWSKYYEHFSRGVALRNFSLCGWNPGDKSVWIWGAPYEHMQVKNSIKARLGIKINRRILFNAFNYSKSDFKYWLDVIIKSRPHVIYGYATILLEFAEYLIQENIKVDFVKCVLSTTEKLTQRHVIAEAFNAPVWDQYGCREIGAIGIETEEGIFRVADDNVALNIYSKNEIVLTALHSYGFPLINYLVGDEGVDCSDIDINDKLPLSSLKLSVGRLTDNFLKKDGRKVSSSAFSVYLSTFKLGVCEQQVIQNDFCEFAINYVPGKNFNKDYKDIINKAFKEYFGENTNITFKKMKKIPVEKSGKKLMAKRMFNYDE